MMECGQEGLCRYLCDGGYSRVTSFIPHGFKELFFHSSSENCRSSSIIPWPNGIKVPVVILSNVPEFSNVASFDLKSKSRLSYAIVLGPSFESSHITCCLSAISDFTIIIFPMDATDTLHPP